jgi:hypothetical protein
MRRGIGLLLLIISVLWQSLALAGGQGLPVPADDPTHAALHLEQEAHHHHDDGSYHQDDSEEAVAHVTLDGALNLTALLSGTPEVPAVPARVVPSVQCLLHIPAPPPDGLRRPPRTHA